MGKAMTPAQNALARKLVADLVAKLERDGVSDVQKEAARILDTDQSRVSVLAATGSTAGTSSKVLINAGRALGREEEVMVALGLPFHPTAHGDGVPQSPTIDLAVYISRGIRDPGIVDEVLKNPAAWPLPVAVMADSMRHAKYSGWPARRRLEEAEHVLGNMKPGDAAGVDAMVQREHGPKDPTKKKTKPKRSKH